MRRKLSGLPAARALASAVSTTSYGGAATRPTSARGGRRARNGRIKATRIPFHAGGRGPNPGVNPPSGSPCHPCHPAVGRGGEQVEGLRLRRAPRVVEVRGPGGRTASSARSPGHRTSTTRGALRRRRPSTCSPPRPTAGWHGWHGEPDGGFTPGFGPLPPAWKGMRVALIRPFRALRPPRALVGRVAAPPYDVVDTAEARALAAGNPDSFLRISRPEIDLGDVDPHRDEVYALGRANLEDFVRRGVLVRDEAPGLLVYRQQMGAAVQTGVVVCASVQEYRSGLIATHEHTRPDKELDRTRHIDALGAHDEPVFLMYRPDAPGATTIAAKAVTRVVTTSGS